MKQYSISLRVRGKDRSARTNSRKKAENSFAPFFNAFLEDMFPKDSEKPGRAAFFTFTIRVDEYSSAEAAPAETF